MKNSNLWRRCWYHVYFIINHKNEFISISNALFLLYKLPSKKNLSVSQVSCIKIGRTVKLAGNGICIFKSNPIAKARSLTYPILMIPTKKIPPKLSISNPLILILRPHTQNWKREKRRQRVKKANNWPLESWKFPRKRKNFLLRLAHAAETSLSFTFRRLEIQ